MAPLDPRTFPQVGEQFDTVRLALNVKSLRGGMNDKLHPTELAEDEAVLLENVLLKEGGLAKKRKGSTDVMTGVSPSGNVVGLGYWNPQVTPPEEKILACAQNGIFEWDNGASWSSITGGSFSGTEPVYFVQGSYISPSYSEAGWFFQRGATDVYEYDGTTTLSTVSGAASGVVNSVPTGVDGVFWLGRLWVAEDGTNNGYIRHSEFGKPTTFDLSLGYLVNPSDEVTRIFPWFNVGLIVFQKNSIWGLGIDQANFDPLIFDSTQIELLNSEIGCIAGKSVSQSGQDIFFLSRFGVMRLSKTARDQAIGRAIPISDRIESTIQRINWSAASVACGVTFDNLYLLAVPVDGASYNNLVLVYDIREDAWCQYSGWYAGDWKRVQFPGEAEKLYFGTSQLAGASAAGEVYEAFSDSGTDAGLGGATLDLDGQIDTPRYDWGTTDRKKLLRYIDVFTDGQSGGVLEIYAAPDNDDFSLMASVTVNVDQLTLPFSLPATLGNVTVQQNRVYLDGFEAANEIRFRFKMTGTSQTKILYYTVGAQPAQQTWSP